MDWFSWLSKTTLEPSLTYEYGLLFARNELQADDIAYFNHEFLQSMGISVAKHRLEILKLAKAEIGARPYTLSALILATKRRFNKYISRWVSREELAIATVPEKPHHNHDLWRGSLSWKQREMKEENVMKKCRKIARSGPLDRRGQDKLMVTNRSLKLSGPLDVKAHEKTFYMKSPRLSGPQDGLMMKEQLMLTSRSPMISGPLDLRGPSPKVCNHCHKEKLDGQDDAYDDHLNGHPLWITMFHDMKPT